VKKFHNEMAEMKKSFEISFCAAQNCGIPTLKGF